jgi:hypothetical protein
MRQVLVKIIVVFILITTSLIAQTKDSLRAGTGILFGDHHAFSLTAPQGWVLDNESGVSQGLHAVFYPAGGSWEKSPAVMYGNGFDKDTTAHESLQKFIADDSLRFRGYSSKLTISELPPVKNKNGDSFKILQYFSDNYEAVAYIEEIESFSIVVLTARDKESYEKSLPAFKDLVASYWFITGAVDIKN